MTIETGPTPASPKSPTTESGSTKSKTATSQNAGGASAGFSAILEMVGADPAPEAPSAIDVASAENPETQIPMDPAVLLAQSMQIPVPVSEEGVGSQAPSTAGSGRFARRVPDSGLMAGIAQDGEGNAVQVGGSLVQAGRPSAANKGALGSMLPTVPSNSQGQTDAKPQKFAGELEAARGQQSAPEPQSIVPSFLPGVEKPAREQSLFRSETIEAKFSSPLGVTQAVENASAPVAMGEAGATTGVSEQVTYWISQDVQKAEMMLDGVGETPVEVSIRMSGNEAHVAFRSDESQTRDVLQSASADLKDMLSREGVMLTGISVGASGAGDSGGQERKSRQGGKQAQVEVTTTPTVATHRPGVGGAGRAVDLFV